MLPALLLVTCMGASGQNVPLPQLVTKGFTKQLLVDGKPFLVLGGELGNSSASSIAYMKPHWKKLKDMQLNTVLFPVYWELMEPAEGRFDFSLLDSMISSSRRHQLKVVLLWFGAWKNSMSCYAPAWVKTDQQRFPRAQNSKGKGLEILSAFSNSNLEADTKAFAALLGHLKKTDRQHTVIMIQVENEIGMLTEAREYTADANKLFNGDVPAELMDYLVSKKDVIVPELKAQWSKNGYLTKGNWETVFGKGLSTDEIFQAWHYAKFTHAVATAGKQVYALPVFVNAALNHRDVLPGQYPSAGPLPHLMDIWQAAAPAIDMLSPDFYTPRFKHFSDLFARRNNPFFIPEIRFEQNIEAKVFYAVGHYHALGFSPFSIESVTDAPKEPLGKSYSILAQLSPLILRNQGTAAMDGVLLDSANSRQTIVLGKYTITLAHDYTLGWSPAARQPGWPETGAIIMQESADEFIIAGTGVVATFSRTDDAAISVGILQADEGNYINNKWIAGRRMNGDQDHQGRHIRIEAGEWGIQKVKLYTYQ